MPDRNDIATVLRDRIRAGGYPTGTKMPSTREIAGEFGGSRATASAALHLLADEGFVTLKDKSTAVVGSPETSSETLEDRLANVGEELLAVCGDLAEVQQRLNEVADRLAKVLDRLEMRRPSTRPPGTLDNERRRRDSYAAEQAEALAPLSLRPVPPR
jgi:DNA-binding FadR family transcriptional regulator